jgi:cholestenol Delta-isomerase
MVALVPMLLLTVAAGVLAWRLRKERLLTFWLLWSGLIHIVMEASYGAFSEIVKTKSAITFSEFLFTPAPFTSWFDPRWWASVYTQYARYDARYAEQDPLVVFICYTEFLLGPMCFLLVWLIQKGSAYRHRLQLVLCTAQFYGTVLYFLMPLVQGSWSRVMTHDPLELWVFVILLNGLWMIVPGGMVYQSFRQRTVNTLRERAVA